MITEAVVTLQTSMNSSRCNSICLKIKADEKYLLSISANADGNNINKYPIKPPSEIIAQTKVQLQEFFMGERKTFDLPINPDQGTEFQRRVWSELRKIPCGETRTYGEIARLIGSPKAARAVGMACNKNPLLIVTPCHRVVGSNGSLVGFACGLDIKQILLDAEK